jgi:glycosyltransferase involved in cell wall biosynthesis
MNNSFINLDSNKRNTIVVNDIAATSAGAYTVLVLFLEELSGNPNAAYYNWIVFVSADELTKYNSDNIHVVNINSGNWFKRMLWDLIGLKLWLKKHKINVYRLCSLQNTGIPFFNCDQYVYIHQSLILRRDIKLKWIEWKMSLYRFIYYYSVKWTVNNKYRFIVQTKWMKDELSKQFKLNSENIFIIPPKFDMESGLTINESDKFSFQLFYPAVPHASYKNHELIIKALAYLKELNFELLQKLKVIFTTKPEFNKLTQYCFKLSKKLGVEGNIEWAGYLDKDLMEKNYFTCDIFLFPSKLESYGLPLLEAAYRRKTICTLDTGFARELLMGYDGVKYLADDPEGWAYQINQFYKRGIPNNIINEHFSSMESSNKRITDLLMESR